MNRNIVIFRGISSKLNLLKLAIKKSRNAAHQRNIDEKLMFGGVIEKKSERKRLEKNRDIVSKQNIAPDSEVYWLQNLSASTTIKVYRKTADGRYKEVDKKKLIDKLTESQVVKDKCKTTVKEQKNVKTKSVKVENDIAVCEVENNREDLIKPCRTDNRTEPVSHLVRKEEKIKKLKSLKAPKNVITMNEDVIVPMAEREAVTNEEGLEKIKSIRFSGERKIEFPDIVIRGLTRVPMLSSNDSLFTHDQAESRAYPSVTRILSDTMSEDSKNALEKWKQKMVAELGEEGFQIFNKEQLSFGARFHSSIKKFLEKTEFEVDNDLTSVWGSVQGVLQNISKVRLVEANVVHPKLKYKGVVDCVASYKSMPSVIEWKVSEKAKPKLSYTYDAPLQLSAYLGALSYDYDHKMDLRNGLVVVAYKDGSPAEAFPLDEILCQKYWSIWLKRLQLYWQLI